MRNYQNTTSATEADSHMLWLFLENCMRKGNWARPTNTLAIIVVAWSALAQLPAFGQEPGINEANLSFFPGDAFFPAKLSESVTHEASGHSELRLVYRRPRFTGGLGAFAGFENLVIEDVDREVVHDLVAAYRLFRQRHYKTLQEMPSEGGTHELIETNPFHLFVYSRTCDFGDQRIGLKYNKDWASETSRLLSRPSHLAKRAPDGTGGDTTPLRRQPYVTFIPTAAAVAEDWRNAAKFPPLPVVISDEMEWRVIGPPYQTPAKISMAEVMLVVLEEHDLHGYFAQSERFRWVEVLPAGESRICEFTKSGVDSERLRVYLEQNPLPTDAR